MKDILNFINGEYVSNVSGKTYEKRNPVDNSLIGMVHEAGKPEVDAAVAAAKAALKGPWGKLSVVERCNMLDAIVAEINNRFDDFLQAEIADTGKPATLASHIDIPAARPTSRSSPTPSRTCRPNPSRCAPPTARPPAATACAPRAA
jgi:aminomuconate-semialdehyde/2-hydroxymuconate-6-semialdehyde dehydrogenase